MSVSAQVLHDLLTVTTSLNQKKNMFECFQYLLSVNVLTAKDITRLIMPSLSSPCLPLRLNHSSTTLPSLKPSGMVTWVHAILSSMENALWMEHKKRQMEKHNKPHAHHITKYKHAERKSKKKRGFSLGCCSINSAILEFETNLPFVCSRKCLFNHNAVMV